MFEFNTIAVGALAVSVVCSLTYVGFFQLQPVTPARAAIKTTATGALVVAALAGGVSVLFAVALGVATLGDYVKTFRSERSLMAAIALSGLMQVLTCIWFARELWVGIETPLVAILGVFGMTGGFFALVWPKLGARAAVVVPFMLTSLALFSLGLGAAPGRPLLMLGVMFYLLSLLLLGCELILFHGSYRFLRIVGPVIWVFYHAGLVLMTIGGAE